MAMAPRTLYRDEYKRKERTEPDANFHNDDSVERNMNKGFHELCKGCCHIRLKKGVGKSCVYLTEPKKQRFPCFFRVHVAKGGFDGKYGATVNNYIKPSEKAKEKLAKGNRYVRGGEEEREGVEQISNSKTTAGTGCIKDGSNLHGSTECCGNEATKEQTVQVKPDVKAPRKRAPRKPVQSVSA